MEKNYIKTTDAQAKSAQWAQKLESSPVDKHKAKFGEADQANYLLLAKERSADKHARELFNNEIKEESKSPEKKYK